MIKLIKKLISIFKSKKLRDIKELDIIWVDTNEIPVIETHYEVDNKTGKTKIIGWRDRK